jgi:hypothetical protein
MRDLPCLANIIHAHHIFEVEREECLALHLGCHGLRLGGRQVREVRRRHKIAERKGPRRRGSGDGDGGVTKLESTPKDRPGRDAASDRPDRIPRPGFEKGLNDDGAGGSAKRPARLPPNPMGLTGSVWFAEERPSPREKGCSSSGAAEGLRPLSRFAMVYFGSKGLLAMSQPREQHQDHDADCQRCIEADNRPAAHGAPIRRGGCILEIDFEARHRRLRSREAEGGRGPGRSGDAA